MVSLICSKNYLKMKKLFLLLLIIVCKFTIAQNTLNIFTHQGEKFILFLNGEQINLLPESKVKKENISATVQNVRIEFENKNNLQITENIYYEAGNEYTYIIKKKKVKANKVKRINKNAPLPIQYVLRLLEVKPMKATAIVPIPDDLDVEIKQNNTAEITVIENKVEEDTKLPECKAVDEKLFNEFILQFKNLKFDDVKLKTYKLYLTNNCINIKQIKLVLNEITFEENKLKAAKMSYIKTTDKNEYFLLNDSFKFTTTINELNDYILNKKYLTNEE